MDPSFLVDIPDIFSKCSKCLSTSRHYHNCTDRICLRCGHPLTSGDVIHGYGEDLDGSLKMITLLFPPR